MLRRIRDMVSSVPRLGQWFNDRVAFEGCNNLYDGLSWLEDQVDTFVCEEITLEHGVHNIRAIIASDIWSRDQVIETANDDTARTFSDYWAHPNNHTIIRDLHVSIRNWFRLTGLRDNLEEHFAQACVSEQEISIQDAYGYSDYFHVPTSPEQALVNFREIIRWGRWTPNSHVVFPDDTDNEIHTWLMVSKRLDMSKGVSLVICSYIATE